jgi:hypothetical protein
MPKLGRCYLMAVIGFGANLAMEQSADASLTVTIDDGSSAASSIAAPTSTSTVYYVSEHGGQTSVTTSNPGSSKYDYSIQFTTLPTDSTSSLLDVLSLTALVTVSPDGIKKSSDSPVIITLSDVFTKPASVSVTLTDALSYTGFSDPGGGGSDDSMSGTARDTSPSNSTVASFLNLDPLLSPSSSGNTSSSTAPFTAGSSYTLTNILSINLGSDRREGGEAITATNTVTLPDPPATPEPSTIVAALTGLVSLGAVALLRRHFAFAFSS